MKELWRTQKGVLIFAGIIVLALLGFLIYSGISSALNTEKAPEPIVLPTGSTTPTVFVTEPPTDTPTPSLIPTAATLSPTPIPVAVIIRDDEVQTNQVSPTPMIPDTMTVDGIEYTRIQIQETEEITFVGYDVEAQTEYSLTYLPYVKRDRDKLYNSLLATYTGKEHWLTLGYDKITVFQQPKDTEEDIIDLFSVEATMQEEAASVYHLKVQDDTVEQRMMLWHSVRHVTNP